MPESYRDGAKFIDGRRISASDRRVFTSSNGFTKYTATRWADGTASCDCPGWVNHHGKGGTCWHCHELLGIGTRTRRQRQIAQGSKQQLITQADAPRVERKIIL